jgi:hypothetical protein
MADNQLQLVSDQDHDHEQTKQISNQSQMNE